MKTSDLKWSFRGVTVRETGVFIPFNISLLKDIWTWWRYYRAEIKTPPTSHGSTIDVVCHPREIQPYYLLWGAMRQAALKPLSAKDSLPSDNPNYHIYFSDRTYLEQDITAPEGINRDCLDISKTHVASVFEEVFGYSLSVDPRTATPPFICKSELNGKHDGYIAYENCDPQNGWVYQKLIQTETKDGTVLDLRSPTVFGDIPLIFLKERPVAKRFANMNSRCRLAKAEDYLSAHERALISQFCQKMKLDWGGLDILRDAKDGKIYIVDVNKTDMGPPFALPLKDKLESTQILGQALRHAMETHYPSPPSC